MRYCLRLTSFPYCVPKYALPAQISAQSCPAVRVDVQSADVQPGIDSTINNHATIITITISVIVIIIIIHIIVIITITISIIVIIIIVVVITITIITTIISTRTSDIGEKRGKGRKGVRRREKRDRRSIIAEPI